MYRILHRSGIKGGLHVPSRSLKEPPNLFRDIRDSMTGFASEFIHDVKFVATRDFSESPQDIVIDDPEKQLISRFSKVHSDADYGGKSVCMSEILPEGKNSSFVRFQGTLDYEVNKDAKIKRTGFCAAQAVCKKTLDLGEYEGIELVVRSKFSRSYVFGLKTVSLSMLNDMNYQVYKQAGYFFYAILTYCLHDA
jgi:hypothetical protein